MADQSRTTPESYPSWGEPDGSVVGYMCRTDWECELGMASGGNVIFPSVDNIKKHLRCASSCGIVEVEVRFRRIVEAGTDD